MRADLKDITTIAKWASIECEKQRSGERSVGWMVEAWVYAVDAQKYGPPGIGNIQVIGSLVEPHKNESSYWRRSDVMVGYDVMPHSILLPRLMLLLVEAWDTLSSDEWYKEFEEIHPFIDGNGRTGNILWNWHRGTLDPALISFPPDFWGSKRLTFTESADAFD